MYLLLQATFRMPQASNPDLANFISRVYPTSETNPTPINQDAQNRNFRVVHVGDGVPDLLALQTFAGRQYRHLTPSFSITSDNTVLAPAITDVQISSRDGISQLTGVPLAPASGILFPADLVATGLAHQWYFGFLNACF
jgi:hypothetical protein